ncbi:MAG: hypothetical protein GY708_15275 [Actinomycetia bacterium]|nr:hypothetical protein [Actinomycetes bacterium]MCP4958087.1 hypothetical protein [Actinomycetes bacterium]
MRSTSTISVILAMCVCLAACSEPDLRSTPDQRPTSIIHGISYPVWAEDGYSRVENAEHITQIAATGANWISFTITWYQPNTKASCPEPTIETAHLDGLDRVTELAADAGLHVAIKAMVDVSDGTYRGELEPADLDRWFTCYGQLMAEIADRAERSGAELIVVGTEFISLEQYDERWRSLIADLRERFSGSLTYSVNFTDVGSVDFWDDLDLIGVSAYWPLSEVPTTDVDALVEAWQPVAALLDTMSLRWDRPILLAELGYRSVEGATTAPWDWATGSQPADEEQEAAFAAAARVWQRRDTFGGVLIWAWDDLADTDEDQATDYTPRGKPAESIIRTWFSTT